MVFRDCSKIVSPLHGEQAAFALAVVTSKLPRAGPGPWLNLGDQMYVKVSDLLGFCGASPELSPYLDLKVT